MIYRALHLKPNHPGGMRCLSDFHAREGTEQFSAVTLEYALSGAFPLSDEDRETLDNLRFLDVWSWGFSKHKTGQPHLDGEAFKHRDDFVLDSASYKAFVDGLVGPSGSLEAAHQAAHRLCGVMAGFLRHSTKPSPGLEDVIDPAQFAETDEYQTWLESSASDLEALDRSMQSRKQKTESAPLRPWWKRW